MTTYDVCIWCESTGPLPEEIDHVHYHPSEYKDADSAMWTEYECKVCGAKFRIGEKTITFNEFTNDGDSEKALHAGCFNCYWSMNNPDYDAAGCPVCPRGGTIGDENPDVTDNWTPLTKTQACQEV